jgi:hypothetical protein
MYYQGEVYKEDFPAEASRTWDYSSHFSSRSDKVKYAKLYCSGKTLNQMCPSHLLEDWTQATKKYQSHYRSVINAKINIQNAPLYKIIPMSVMKNFYSHAALILENIFNTIPEPKNYDSLDTLNRITKEISQNNLLVDKGFLSDYQPRNHLEKSFLKKMLTEDSLRIKYDIFGTITGRMTTHKSGLSIMTMPRELRTAIMPKNDFLVELDYNAAELRVALSLLGLSQPKEDLHDWNMANVFVSTKDRQEAKKKIFSWLYNSEAQNEEIEKIYDRKLIISKYYGASKVKNFFGREIECEPRLALNYIIQSTAADMFTKQLSKVYKLICDRRTNILYTMHDSVVLDFANEDRDLLKQIVEAFSDTDLGSFLVNFSVGSRYNDMKETKWIR